MIPAIEKSRTKPQKNPAGVHVMIFFRQGVRTPQSLAHTAARLHSKTEKDRPFPPCSQAAVVTTVGPKVVANWRPMQLVGRPLVIGDVGVVFWSRAGAVSAATLQGGARQGAAPPLTPCKRRILALGSLGHTRQAQQV